MQVSRRRGAQTRGNFCRPRGFKVRSSTMQLAYSKLDLVLNRSEF